MRLARAGKSRPHLIAPGEMPPFVGMAGEAFLGHQPVQQAAVGARFLVGKRKIIRRQRFEPVAAGKRGDIVEQRAHPQRLAILPFEREIDRRAGGVRRRRIFVGAGRGPVAFHLFGQPRAGKPRIAALQLRGIQTSWK